MMTFLSATNYY